MRLHPGEYATRCGFDLDNSFIRLDPEQRFALGNAIVFFFPPSEKLAGFLCHFQSGHYDTDGHRIL